LCGDLPFQYFLVANLSSSAYVLACVITDVAMGRATLSCLYLSVYKYIHFLLQPSYLQ